MTAYTPPPWTPRFTELITAIKTPRGEMQITTGNHLLRPRLYVSPAEWETNIHLMALAPEVLEILIAVAEGLTPEMARHRARRVVEKARALGIL